MSGFKIPDFTAIGQADPKAPDIVGQNPDAQAPGMASAFLGQQMQESGGKLQDLLDRTNTMQAINAFHQNAADIGNKFYSLSGAALSQAYPQYIQDLSNNANDIANTLTTNQARQAFQAETQGHIAQEMYRAGVHAGDGLKQYNNETYSASMDLDRTDFSNQILAGDFNAAATTLHNSTLHTQLHLTHDLGIPEGDPIIQDTLNTHGALFMKSGLEAVGQLPITDPRRAAIAGAFVEGGQAALNNSIQQGNAPPQNFTPQQVSAAILGHESGANPNAPNSGKGAVGEGQIMPATFDQYAKPGESIVNNADNLAVHNRIVNDYMTRFNGDPARVAVAYVSGPGNVAPQTSPTPWIEDKNDGNENVSDYVKNVTGRLGYNGAATGPGAEPQLVSTPAIHGIPVQAADARKMVSQYKADLSSAYRLQKDQQEMQDTQTMNKLEPLLANNTLTSKQIEDSPASGQLKMKLHEALLAGPGRTDTGLYGELFKRIHAPNDDPEKLTNADSIVPLINYGITPQNWIFLSDEIKRTEQQEKDDPDDKIMKDQTLKVVKQQVSGEDRFPGMKDPKGEVNYGAALPKVIAAFKKGRQDGIPTSQLYDTLGPNWVGLAAKPFIRPQAQWYSELAAANLAPDAEPAKPQGSGFWNNFIHPFSNGPVGNNSATKPTMSDQEISAQINKAPPEKRQQAIIDAYARGKGSISRQQAEQLLISGGYAVAPPQAPRPE